MKVLFSFKIFYEEDIYPTMYTRVDNNKYYMTYTMDEQVTSTEISLLQYASAYANYLPFHLDDSNHT
jgi:hypothetical protein